MVTLDQFIDRFNKVVTELEVTLPDQVLISANNGIAVIEQRILEKGKDAEGQAWRDYKESYKEYKKSKRKYVGYVNFKLTGRMLANIGIIDRKVNGSKVEIFVSARNAEERRKLEANSASRGNLLSMSKQEQRVLRNEFKKRILTRVKKTLGT